MEAAFQTAREGVGDDDEEAIDLFDHCALCLLPFSDNYNYKNIGWSVGEVQSCGLQVQKPKLTTFQHLWKCLGVETREEKEWQFINRISSSSNSKLKQFTCSGIPPMCMTCYCNVLILNDFHLQMMKIKKRLEAQAKRLHDIILEAGTGKIDDEDEGSYTGRLRDFYESMPKSSTISVLKTMNFLCQIRSSSPEQDHHLPQFRPRQSEPRMEDWHWPAFSEDEDEEDSDGKSGLSNVCDQDEIIDENGGSEMFMDDSKGDERSDDDDELMDFGNEPTGRASRSSSENEDDDDDYSPVKDSSKSSSEESVSDSDKESKRKRKRKQVLIPRSSKSGMMMVIIPPLDSEKERSQQCEMCSEQIKVTSTSMTAHLETHNFKTDEVYPCPNESCGFIYLTQLRRDFIHLKNSPECLKKANLTIEEVSLLECVICGLETQSGSELQEHLQEHENECEDKYFPCPFPSCSQSFGIQQCLELHINGHIDKNSASVGHEMKQKCDLCPQFIDVPNLEDHYTGSHKIQINDLFKCRQCTLVFPSLTPLMDHKEVHLKSEGTILCDRCPEDESDKFETLLALEKHYRRFHRVGGIPCPKCGKLFSSEIRMKDHMRRIKCDREGKEYYTEAQKIELKCRQCSLTFPSLTALLRHKKVHKDSEGILCDRCPEGESESFESPLALQKHYLKFHRVGGLECPKCGKLFPSVSRLKEHMRKVECDRRKKRIANTNVQRLPSPAPPVPVVFTPEYNVQLLRSFEEACQDETWTLEKDKRQQCEICNSQKPKRDMISHLKTHVGEDYIFLCPNPECSLCYISHERRAKHLTSSQDCLTASNLTLEQVMNVQCQLCDFVTNRTLSLRKHVMVHEEEENKKKYKCPISSCSELFGVKQSIEFHITSHVFRDNLNERNNQKCTVCQKYFAFTMMENHLKGVHQAEEIFRCSQCPYMFPSREALVEHKRFHWKKGQGVKCDLCQEDNASQQNFDDYYQYLSHCEQIHGIHADETGESRETVRTYKEDKDKTDTEPQTEKKRRRKIKSYECEACQPPIVFTSENRYLTHQVKEHGADPYVCRVCKQKFNSRAARNRHCNAKHDPNSKYNKLGYCCEICGKRFGYPSQLSVHKRRDHANHLDVCEHCGIKYRNPGSLRRHIRITHMGIKKWECPTCGMRLTTSNGLKMHLRVHTGEKPYMCEICGKSFSQPGSLISHENKVHKSLSTRKKGDGNRMNN